MLRLTDTILFGRHKGQKVQHIIETNSDYMLWMRDEKLKQRDNFLDEEADALLSRVVKRKLPARFSLNDESLREQMQVKAQREDAYKDTWGEW